MAHPSALPLRRRPALAILAALACTLALPGTAGAQSWPSRPLSLIVPFPAGGTTDVLARALGDRLSQALGQPVIVENKPGAGATLGADYVAKARPDGHTLLIGAVHHTIAGSVYRKLPYDFQRDLVAVGAIATVPNVLVVHPAVPATNVAELVALMKAQPGKLTYGSNGNGTAQHLIGTQFSHLTGTSMTHVPYKGSGPMAVDLLSGQITLSFDTVTPVLQHIRAGKLRALAITTAQRSTALPDVPTLDEAGLKGFDIGTWFGVLAPVGTPADVVARLNTEMVRIIQSAEFRKRMEDIGAEPTPGSSDQLAQKIRAETARFAALVKEAKVSMD
ncbi:Bug family tripartite tricarboxylate transporter substrate binding protein [Acidovorax sp. NCPPB 4044]|uniref:Bug family tripartite tricarboxylate transporter substrate binding protein n=1 Tax=Acidovorax sp. NCPPB 4044 TaxID=2940490 RepID=UPI0023026B86|nr:tripartite tricarboxylate transporter substrate binding protein [Acidovorax sp. NCPPB 4044]MDA8521852.1 tripartite tricarboxylate transporter substrate binding protein [Acidovorax sp. NCPPB 4044]